ncbi:hypothetical protein EGR_04932 [Echinococcus granulosus]|uniref:Uncharacterized protein n=1 Tax=Echinococcus granulosus TaxID=6210 RepID=W6UPM2_ECHGR|nr:hypothetical protein EGR_04932 [Echinococcus granulosus]EUB60222.1 hypothetical protein EGR_04932 [Echinococcus granulosus]
MVCLNNFFPRPRRIAMQHPVCKAKLGLCKKRSEMATEKKRLRAYNLFKNKVKSTFVFSRLLGGKKEELNQPSISPSFKWIM